MRALFIHQNIPGQFRHIMAALCADAGNSIWAIGEAAACQRAVAQLPRLNVMAYTLPAHAAAGHPWLADVDTHLRRGQVVARALQQLKDKGIAFDVIVAHPGWGEALFVKDVFPATPLVSYLEFFYAATGADVGFDPEFDAGPESAQRLRVRNFIHLSALNASDAGFTPTRWQHSRLPREYAGRIAVVHEGLDVDAIRPDTAARLEWSGHVFEAGQPIVTYVARNLEPYRGFHVFMRALPALLAAVPDAQVLVVGGDAVSYGLLPPDPAGWRATMLAELERAGTPLDTRRVHFMGKLPYATYLKVLQVSAAHVYLTYPFVLSWSMLEAMAAGCLVVGSATPPVAEVIVDGENGRLVGFFDRDALVATVAAALRDPAGTRALREAARATAVQRYALKRCVPAAVKLIQALAKPAAG